MNTTQGQTRCAIYLRISLDATGEHLAVDRQREDCLKLAEQRGWTVIEPEFIDNSVSASDRLKKRPGYDAMVAAYAAGEFDAMVCYDLDRLTRQPRQLEDWIDAARDRGLLLVTANGEADLSTDAGRMFARIKAAVARAEIERKSARQKRSARQRSELGKTPKGTRLTGYESDGTVVRAEALVIGDMFARFASGDSLRGIALWLNASGLATRRGAPWNPSTVRTILLNPRYAGRAIYLGAANGRSGGWAAIVDEPTFDLVQHRLADPRRKTQHGTDRKHLGSSLYRCGVCGRPVRSHSGGRYRCPEGGHITRMRESIDRHVLKVVRGRLARRDVRQVLARPDSPESTRRASEIALLRSRLLDIEGDYDAGRIDGRRYRTATDKVAADLTAKESEQIKAMAGASVAGIVTAVDPVQAFDAAPLGAQRACLDFFMRVTLNPAERGRKFDSTTVDIHWNVEE